MLSGLLTLAAAAAQPAPPAPDAFTPQALVAACAGRDGWDEPAPPARLHGSTWYVGTCGITAILVATPQGHVLIDSGTARAAPLVADSIRRAGFRPEDVRWILATHEHHDHVGSHAALQRLTGARVAALPVAARVLSTGTPAADDPQAAHLDPIAPARVDRVLADGGVLRVGKLRLTARATPAHSPGSTSWTWRSCEGSACVTMTYADSASTISADGYRFADHPDRVAGVRRGLAAISSLPCGVLITPHPAASGLFDRMAKAPLRADPQACRAYAAGALERFEARLSQEKASR